MVCFNVQGIRLSLPGPDGFTMAFFKQFWEVMALSRIFMIRATSKKVSMPLS